MPTAPTAPTGLPAAPDPADRTTFNARAYPWSSALHAFGTQLTAIGTNVFNNATEAAASAAAAGAYVGITAASAGAAAQSVGDAAAQVALAQSAANMKGAWAGLTGALSKPATVSHAGRMWALLNNLANVATSQPGATADWIDVTPAPNAYIAQLTSAVITLPVGTANNSLTARVTIDASREMLFFYSSTAVQAVIYDSSTKTYGVAVLVRSGTDIRHSALLIGTDKVLMASVPSGAATFEAVVLSLTGTSIAVGAAVASTLPQTENQGIGKIPVAVGSAYVFSLGLASAQRLIAITVSGTTPTIGASIVLVAMSAAPPLIRAIDSTRLLAVYTAGNISAVPVTVSAGTTLTVGTVAATAGVSPRFLSALSSGRWAMVYSNTNAYGAIISVAGTVATMTVVQLATGDLGGVPAVKVGDQVVALCTATTVNVLTDVSGTATAGTAVATPSVTGCIGYGPDYVAFGGVQGYSVIKISGNNPVLFESATVGTALSTSSTSAPSDDGLPEGVLSVGGKSALVAGSLSVVPVFAASASSVSVGIMSGIYGNIVNQSASVAWNAQQAVAGASIRVNRLEMI